MKQATQITAAAPRPPIDLQNLPVAQESRLAAQPGAHLFVGDDADVMNYMSHYLCHAAASGASIAGIPYPERASTILFGGSDRTLYETQALARKLIMPKTEKARHLQQVSSRPLDPAHHETVELLARHLPTEGCVIIPLERAQSSIEALREGLAAIDRLAAAKRAHVMLILHTDKASDLDPLKYTATECFRFLRAEEDPNCRLAWTLSNLDLDYRRRLGIGGRMVQVEREDDNLAFQVTPFIANQVRDRVIWNCISSGLTQTETGAIVGHYKATISRILRSGMPRPDKEKVKKDWWLIYTNIFEFSEEIREKLSE